MSNYDYMRGRIDQEITDRSRSSGTQTVVVPDAARELAIQQESYNQSMALVVALKKARMDRDEWKTYAKKLEARIKGSWAVRDALRDEINKCPNHSAHPLGRNRDAQYSIADEAYIKETERNGLPESQWDDNVHKKP